MAIIKTEKYSSWWQNTFFFQLSFYCSKHLLTYFLLIEDKCFFVQHVKQHTHTSLQTVSLNIIQPFCLRWVTDSNVPGTIESVRTVLLYFILLYGDGFNILRTESTVLTEFWNCVIFLYIWSCYLQAAYGKSLPKPGSFRTIPKIS